MKQQSKGLSDHVEKCQFTTYGVLCPNRSCHHCMTTLMVSTRHPPYSLATQSPLRYNGHRYGSFRYTWESLDPPSLASSKLAAPVVQLHLGSVVIGLKRSYQHQYTSGGSSLACLCRLPSRQAQTANGRYCLFLVSHRHGTICNSSKRQMLQWFSLPPAYI